MKKITILLLVITLSSVNVFSNNFSINDKNTGLLSVSLLKSDSTLSSGGKTQLISVAPIGLINKFRVKYERQINNDFTFGTYFNYYWGLYKGVRIDPIFRFYLGDEAPEGVYLQAKLVIGYFKNPFTYYNDQGVYQDGYWFGNGGAGVNIGYQTLTGKSNNWVIDINVGFKIVSPVGNPNDYTYDGTDVNAIENGIWYLTGPGSIFDGHIGIGYVF